MNALPQNTMSLPSCQISLDKWLEGGPILVGNVEEDMRTLARCAHSAEALLNSLGPKPERSAEQAQHAASIHEACRALRRNFLDLHAIWLYDSLTKGRTIRKSLRELAFEAAEYCPGLVPTNSLMAQERKRSQRDKEGYERDQGLFFHALLGSREVGIHLIESSLMPTARALGLIELFRSSGGLDLGSVQIERCGCAAHITMNNTHCLNAEDNSLVDDMETAVDLALLDDDVQVGVLRGGIMTHPRYVGRRVFSAGINLQALHAGQISFVDFLLRRELGFINKIVRGVLLENPPPGTGGQRVSKKSLEKPWIAAVDSFAIGGGAQLLLVFDHVIAADDSYFSLPAAQEGIVPGFSNLRLSRVLGGRKSRQVILCGRQIWAHEPDAQLLFDEVVNSTEVDLAIDRNVRQLSSPAVVANRHMLNLAEEPMEIFLQYAAEFASTQVERLYSRDVLEKRFGGMKFQPNL